MWRRTHRTLLRRCLHTSGNLERQRLERGLEPQQPSPHTRLRAVRPCRHRWMSNTQRQCRPGMREPGNSFAKRPDDTS
jgi:hypothetical protein